MSVLFCTGVPAGTVQRRQNERVASCTLSPRLSGAPLNLGDKAHDMTISFWRRCMVPSGTPVQNKTDLKLRLTGTENPIL